MTNKAEKWLDTATSGIRFGPDRAEVREELLQHIEDKTADLRRIFPDMDNVEATERALSGMGDPEELKITLAKVHRPWLGWLWQFSKGLLWGAIAVCLFICVWKNDHYQSAGFPLWMDWSGHYGPPASLEPERAELGGYTFRITEAAWLEGRSEIYLAMQVSTPRFWERIEPEGLYNSLTAVAPDGTWWPAGRARGKEPHTMTYLARYDLFTREFGVYIPAEDWEPGDWMSLEVESPLGSIVLSAKVTEKKVKS